MAPILDELDLGEGDRVAVLVNGLGSTTLMELYLLHRRVAGVLAGRKVAIHHSWCIIPMRQMPLVARTSTRPTRETDQRSCQFDLPVAVSERFLVDRVPRYSLRAAR